MPKMPKQRPLKGLRAASERPNPEFNVAGYGTLALTDADWETIATILALSARESQVARQVMDGATEADIAARLSIAPRTVHSHVERLYRKLKVHNRHQLLVRIINTYLSAAGIKR